MAKITHLQNPLILQVKRQFKVQSYYHTLQFMLVIQFLKVLGPKLKPLCNGHAIQTAYGQMQCSRSWGGYWGGEREREEKITYEISL